MLNSRKSEPAAAPATPAPAVQSYASSYTPPPASNSYGAKESNHSIVDIHLTMKGDLESEGDVLVKGKVIGNIRCKLLIIDIDALVDGGVEAEEVVIRGRSKLEKTAQVDSEIEHMSFSAEEGARVTGALKYRSEPIKRTNTISLVA
jgi:cytoskeletal protein CcmA (bactofilin family)